MACVTLKRTLNFDPLNSPSRPTKRRRCVPLHCTSEEQTGANPNASASPFRETPLTPEQIANNLRDEMKRLKKRRQFVGGQSSPGGPSSPGSAPLSPEPMMDTEHTQVGSSKSPGPTGGAAEKPIFTLRQMTIIAERMCEERVEQVRSEYDQILNQKLSEQYDAFVKFIDHRIQKRFNESHAPSYLS